MSKSFWGDSVDKRDGMGNGLRALDDSLTWVRPSHRSATRSQGRGWPVLDREMADLHARFERACIED